MQVFLQEMNQSRPQPSAATLKKLEGLAVEKGWGASVFQPLKQLSKSGQT